MNVYERKTYNYIMDIYYSYASFRSDDNHLSYGKLIKFSVRLLTMNRKLFLGFKEHFSRTVFISFQDHFHLKFLRLEYIDSTLLEFRFLLFIMSHESF